MSFVPKTRSRLQLTVHCHSLDDVLFSIYKFYNPLLVQIQFKYNSSGINKK